jgi:hypothetical protein
MRRIWRFFATEDGRWQWQQIADDRTVVAQSGLSYVDYDHCVAAARTVGYIYEAAQKKITRPGNAGLPRQ